MTERPNSTNQLKRLRPTKSRLPKTQRPFWLPATSFYFLAAAIAIAFFFLVWGVLHDGDEPMPWIPAGVGASVILIGAVFLREIILRKARARYLLIQKRLDYNLNNIKFRHKTASAQKKLSIERNAEIIKQIQKKSDAARILMKLSEGHLEVAEICGEYLKINRLELESVGAGSPRLAALRRGREIVAAIHKFHLLAWAEIESRELTQEAKNRVTIIEKTETAQKALNVLNAALLSYPNEPRLIESEQVVREFIVSIKVSDLIEKAERAAFRGNPKRAIGHYQDALYFLERENLRDEGINLISDKIRSEIAKLQDIASPQKGLKKPDKEQGND